MRQNNEGRICPNSIIDDFGSGYAMGGVMGSIFHFIRGMVISPKKEKFYGGIVQIRRRAPILAGSFAVWSGMFGFFQCVLLAAFKEDTIFNRTLAGALTGGIVQMRGGIHSFIRGFAFGGLFLGLIEVGQVYMMKSSLKTQMEVRNIQYEMSLYGFIKQNIHNPRKLIRVPKNKRKRCR